MDYEALLELAKSRRTIRVIKPAPVPDELIHKALEVARWAPTGFNLQPTEFVVLTDLESRTAVKKIVGRARRATKSLVRRAVARADASRAPGPPPGPRRPPTGTSPRASRQSSGS